MSKNTGDLVFSKIFKGKLEINKKLYKVVKIQLHVVTVERQILISMVTLNN